MVLNLAKIDRLFQIFCDFEFYKLCSKFSNLGKFRTILLKFGVRMD